MVWCPNVLVDGLQLLHCALEDDVELLVGVASVVDDVARFVKSISDIFSEELDVLLVDLSLSY